MPSSYTPRLRLELQAAGENLNTWGAPKLNNAISRIDFAIAGRTVLALGATAAYTLTSSNGDDEARAAILDITSLTTPCVITIPSAPKTYTVRNGGGAVATLSTGAGASVALEPGAIALVTCDGANVSQLGYAGYGLKQYIDNAALSATGSMPAVTGNAGKLLYCDGVIWEPLDLDAIAAADNGTYALWIPAGAMNPRATNGASPGLVETTTNKVMLSSLDFDASTIEYAQFGIRMPASWNEGTITFVPEWSHAATTVNFKVSWGLQAVAFSDGDAADAAFGTAIYSNDTGGTTNTLYAGPESAAVTIAGTPLAQDYVVFQVLRKADDGTNDTLAIDARLHGVTVLIKTNTWADA
ncbi:hypothetical protein BH10PSE5_BH10PSE5_34300 [soil metagenome]